MDDKQQFYFGSCLCGAVTYKVAQIEPRMANCHCSMCRKFHGAAYATFGEAKAENFHWLSGVEQLRSYTAPNHTTRRFCGQCGSSLTFAPANDDQSFVEFALGTLDTATVKAGIALKPDAHIYIESKADWVELNDSLPQYLNGRDSTRIK